MKGLHRFALFTTFAFGSLAACNAVLDNQHAELDDDGGGALVSFDGSTGAVPGDAHAPGDAGIGDTHVEEIPDGMTTTDASPLGDAGPPCGPGQKRCFGQCVSTTDPLYGCGASSCSACALPRATAVCAGGSCAVGTCNAGYADCNQNAADGCETDLSQASHCGSCNSVCGAAAPLCAPTSGGFACVNGCQPQAPTLCGTQCVNLTTSVGNCGQCGNACPSVDNGQVSCTQSNCHFTCNAGFHACGSACASNMDPATCGSRCTPCPTPANSIATCSQGGKCGFACLPGFHKCGDQCLPNDAVTSCGTACTPCPAPANGDATCTNGACGFTCNAGFHACGAVCAANGSTATCGGSCTPCPIPANASATCTNGACGYVCAAGFADCDGNAANGCEVDLATNANHCGSCPVACPGTACVGGVCQPAPVDAGAD